jgi:hypothetical protein
MVISEEHDASVYSLKKEAQRFREASATTRYTT